MKNTKSTETKPKYKIGDYVKLIDDNWEIEKLVHILDINDEIEHPDYYVDAIYIKSQERVKVWIDEEEIVKKTNAKEKIKFK